MYKRLLVLVVLVIVAGCASQQSRNNIYDGKLTQSEVNKINREFRTKLNSINQGSLKHYGIKAAHSMIVNIDGNFIINITAQAFNLSNQSIEKQIAFMMYQIRAEGKGMKLVRMGIYTATILIDGKFHSVHRI